MNPVLPASSPEDLLVRPGTLAVVRPEANGRPKIFVVLFDTGGCVGFNGHVDLGTGIRTSLSQIIAEELDLPMAGVAMVLGDTLWTPDQGSTTASETIQFTAVPLRRAAAQARRWLVARAAERLGVDPAELDVNDGQVLPRGGANQGLSYAELIAGETIVLQLDETTPVKDHSRYSIVGRSVPRVDIPDKATGLHTYVHDVRLPGMLHGRVIRPPYAGRDGGAFIGRSLASVDESSVTGMPGVLQVVVIHDFVGIVAEREEQAEAAAKALKVQWKSFEDLPGLNPPENAIRANPAKPRVLRDDGDIDEKLADAATRLTRTYVWPYQMHASIGPCCSVAAFDEGRLTVWSGTQTQQMLKSDLALLLDMPVEDVEIIRLETAGSFGRSGMDDVGADAALLSRAVGRPVRVQLSRDQEHAWEPKGAGQLMDVDGGLDADGDLYVYDFASRYPSNMAPMLALLLTRKVEPIPATQAGGDRTAIPAYHYPSIRAVTHDMPAIVRAAFFRGVSALPNVFAHESFIDELAEIAGVDPVEYRLRYVRDDRVCDLVRAVAERAGWTPHVGPQRQQVAPDIVRGRGFAYATYVHGPFPGRPAAAAAWVADVEVNTATGQVAVTRVTVGQDSGMMINPDGVRHQIEGNVVQSTSRSLMEEVIYDEKAVVSRDWSTYPILKFTEVPAIDVALMLRPNDPPMGVGESASVPSAAAIANAVYDATGVRFRELPLTPEKVRAGLLAHAGAQPKPEAKPASKSRSALLAGVAAAAAAALALFSPAKPIAPIAPQGARVFSPETIERGRLVAAAGNCQGCHTIADGPALAGGVALHTPFGVVYGTNITPDLTTGIGAWSYPAFERAMRQGISRDGHHLYPAFPYTAFARFTDADLQALYAYLMAQPAFHAPPLQTKLAFPMSVRPLMAGWNALYNKAEAFTPDPARSPQWNRGAYLVEGAGHCSACHSPRNALGAEVSGERHLGGGVVDGWDAPTLGPGSLSPVPWTEGALYSYLRTGASDQHGATAGPMLAVVAELSALPDSDIRAMAHYLAARAPAHVSEKDAAARAQALSQLGRASLGPPDSVGARVFDGACAVCHANASPDLFGGKVSLPLSSTVNAARPDNLIRTVMSGVSDPSKGARGAMPAFGRQLNDAQLADLVAYIRRTQAVGKPAWDDIPQTIARIRLEALAAAP